MARSHRRRHLLAPEVIQTSSMDCGPAALKCLLSGFGIEIHYGRLREACNTSVDGTSIDALEEVAGMLGLPAEQIMVPHEHLLYREARLLPAIAILRQQRGNHMVVIWRRIGAWVQIMDPAYGRRWLPIAELVGQMYRHEHCLEGGDWRVWMAEVEQQEVMRARLRHLGAGDSEPILRWAGEDHGWRRYAALDASVRMAQAIVDAGALPRGSRTAEFAQKLAQRAAEHPQTAFEHIPEKFWTVLPVEDDELEDGVAMRGTVLLTATSDLPEADRPEHGTSAAADAPERESAPIRPPELTAALDQILEKPSAVIWRMLRRDGLLRPAFLAIGLFVAAIATTMEIVLFRLLLDVQSQLTLSSQRLTALAVLVCLLASILAIEVFGMRGLLAMGRDLEMRFRIVLMRRLPQLGTDYFHSRLISDMAARAHNIEVLRLLPLNAGQIVETVFRMVLLVLAIAWLAPGLAVAALFLAAVLIGLPWLFQSALIEAEMRMRIIAAGLGRCYLDAMHGLSAVRAHNGERTMRREQDAMLMQWSEAARRFNRYEVLQEGVQALIGFGGAAILISAHFARTSADPGILIVAYWLLQLPLQGRAIAVRLREYAAYRNIALRIIELCDSGEESKLSMKVAESSSESEPAFEVENKPLVTGVTIEFDSVDVVAGGHCILSGINLKLSRGEHVAIVGPSGSGKSTLLGTLLGWHRVFAGELRVDGLAIAPDDMHGLRGRTVWIEPGVQLWNRTFLENLIYGAERGGADRDLGAVLDACDLHSILRGLEDGLQTTIGDGGARLSGGEGQRLRIARGLLRHDAALVLLDEAFRGLERDVRRALLRRIRAWWPHATLLFISHDVEDTLGFDRVVAMEAGRVVEDGRPAELAARTASHYARLLAAERETEQKLWGSSVWRRLRLEAGQLHEHSSARSS